MTVSKWPPGEMNFRSGRKRLLLAVLRHYHSNVKDAALSNLQENTYFNLETQTRNSQTREKGHADCVCLFLFTFVIRKKRRRRREKKSVIDERLSTSLSVFLSSRSFYSIIYSLENEKIVWSLLILWKWPWINARMMTVCASSSSPTSSIHLFKWKHRGGSPLLLYIYSDFRCWIVADPDGLLFVYFTFLLLSLSFCFFSSALTSLTNFIIIEIDKLLDERTNLFHTSSVVLFQMSTWNKKREKKRRHTRMFNKRELIRCLASSVSL